MNTYEVTQAKYIKNYIVNLTFNSGVSGNVNLKKYLGKGVFKELIDEEKFKKFELNKESGTICWYTGADIAPDTLYAELKIK
ncbi:DUF2442 domain-containing protein [Candidatus Peregrinibacteria bacterium]|jgi:hypothetical protein|nr:DUF2442 domain-containing protein [Candidatus Peregrinibacteria bacterium]